MPEIKTIYAIKFGDYYLDSDDFDSYFSKWEDMKLVKSPNQLCKAMQFETYDKANQFAYRCWCKHHLFSVSPDRLEVVPATVVDWDTDPYLEIQKKGKEKDA